MEGLILLLLVVVVLVFVVPAVALAKASRALRAIEELKQRLLMLEARLHRSSANHPVGFSAATFARYRRSAANTRDETDHPG